MKYGGMVTVVLSIVIGISSVAYAASVAHEVQKGNRLYVQERFNEALVHYDEAQLTTPESDIVNFNRGAALYKKGEYQKSINASTKALTSENADVEAEAYYNIGNNTYRLGDKEGSANPTAAIRRLKEALSYYKKAIERNEHDVDAKYNYEFVEKKLNELEQSQKEQQQQQGDRGDQQKQQDQREGQEQKDERPTPGEQEPDEREEQRQEPQQQPETDEGEEGEDRREQPQASQEEAEAMSEAEARLLLEGHRQEEQAQPKKKLRMPAGYPEVLKDW
jgi:Ca-activated chloride channel family protein